MKFEIKSRFDGKILFSIEIETLKLAVEAAVKNNTNLRSADLGSADLANADLRGADLRDAKGINKYITTPLYILLDQVGKIRAYKLTKENDEGPFYGGIKYTNGTTVEIEANKDEIICCSYGISVATLDWCIKEWKPGYKIKIVEFTKNNIACIPIGSDGKFRVSKCKVIKEVNLIEI